MITEKEEQFRKIQDEYDSFTYMFYESMRNGSYTFDETCEQSDKLIKEIQEMKKFKLGGTKECQNKKEF